MFNGAQGCILMWQEDGIPTVTTSKCGLRITISQMLVMPWYYGTGVSVYRLYKRKLVSD